MALIKSIAGNEICDQTCRDVVNNISVGGRNLAYKNVTEGKKYTNYEFKYSRGGMILYTANILKPYVSETVNTKGEDIVLSFDYKLAENGTSRFIQVYAYQSSGVSIANSSGFTPTNSWQKFVLKTNVYRYNQGYYSNGSPYTYGEIWCYDGAGSNYYYIRNIKLELGNKPTDWSPAPEDVCAMTDDGNGNVTIGIY